MAPLNIIIVGAGMGGLAAAVGLARNGHKVTVYERSRSCGGVGYSFTITPNSQKCLRYLDIDLEAGGACPVDGWFLHDSEGNVITEMKENQADQRKKGTLSVFAYRTQAHQQLWDAAINSGAQLNAGVKVEAVNATKSTVAIEGGENVSADLIIGADGIRSVVRPQVVDSSSYFPRCSTGHNAFRYMIPTQKVAEDELLSSLYKKTGNNFFSWTAINGNRRVLAYPVDFGKQINVLCTHPQHMSDNEAAGQDEGTLIDYNQKVSYGTATSIYNDYEPRAKRLLELGDPNGFRIWKLEDMDEIPRWSVNNTVLLGDACHAVLSFGFSGASMAIEDALTLVTFLPSDVEKEQLPDRLRLYEEIRKPRIGRVRDMSRSIESRHNDAQTTRDYFLFLFKHDPIAYAKEELARHEAGRHEVGRHEVGRHEVGRHEVGRLRGESMIEVRA